MDQPISAYIRSMILIKYTKHRNLVPDAVMSPAFDGFPGMGEILWRAEFGQNLLDNCPVRR
jgi:hypothetical protein